MDSEDGGKNGSNQGYVGRRVPGDYAVIIILRDVAVQRQTSSYRLDCSRMLPSTTRGPVWARVFFSQA
jgi:hypothetical protein